MKMEKDVQQDVQVSVEPSEFSYINDVEGKVEANFLRINLGTVLNFWQTGATSFKTRS